MTEVKFVIPDADDGNECVVELSRKHNGSFVVDSVDNPGDLCLGPGDLCYCTDIVPSDIHWMMMVKEYDVRLPFDRQSGDYFVIKLHATFGAVRAP